VNLVTIGEATAHSSYTHEHIAFLLRTGRVKGRKSGNLWLVDLDDLKEYEARMSELGPQKHDPTRNESL
jgi:hypothetical protein